jgi:hypothetical protein
VGHIHLGVLPKSKVWKDVVSAIAEAAPDAHVVAASARAAEKDLLNAANDLIFVEAVRLLLAIPLAARSDDFSDGLRRLELQVSESPDVFEIVSASMARLDQIARSRGSTSDLGELASRALAKSLTDSISSNLPGLFKATPEDIQASTRRLSYSGGVSPYVRGFFGNLVSSCLSYWLDRTLPLQVSSAGRFDNVGERADFNFALHQYTSEGSRIIQEFASGWYGKTLHDKGGFTERDSAKFGAVCLKKICSELRLRWPDDA